MSDFTYGWSELWSRLFDLTPWMRWFGFWTAFCVASFLWQLGVSSVKYFVFGL